MGRSVVRATRWFGRHHPPLVTAAIIAAVVSTGVRMRIVGGELPLSTAYRSGFSGHGLLAGRFDTLLTSQLLTRDHFMFASMVVSLAVMLGGYEMLAGSKRAAIVAATGAIAGPGIVTLVLGAGAALHDDFATRTLSTLDYGASAITAAAGGALVATVDRRWLKWGALLFVVGGVVLHRQMADWEHLVACPLGFGIATLLNRESRPVVRFAAVSRRLRDVGLIGTVAASFFGIVSAPAAIAVPKSSPRIVDVRYPTPSLGGDRRVMVVLPANYDSSTEQYPVVEMLHGRPGKPDDLLLGVDLLNLLPKQRSFIAVIPDGHGPAVSNGDFADTSRQRLGAALSDDLRAWVDATYRTNGHWGITGLSAGGYGAASLANREAGGYDRVCPMGGYFMASDPAFKGEAQAVRDAASPLLRANSNGPETLIVVGDHDKAGIAEASAYADALQRGHQSHQVVIVHGAHDRDTWNAGMAVCLPFLTAP